MLPLVILGFPQLILVIYWSFILSFAWLTLVHFLVTLLPNYGFTRFNSADVSVSIESLCNHWFSSVYFLLNFSVIFTRLILSLRSL